MHHFKRVLFCVFFLSSIFGVGLSYAQQCNSGRKIGSDVTPIWRTQSGDGVPIPDLPSGRYALINVIKGIQYEINANYIKVCDGIREVSLSANYGTLFSPQRNFTAPVSGQLRVYYTGSGSGLQIKAIGGQNTTDTKDIPPNENNKWRIHFYGEQPNIAPERGRDARFQNYLGYRDENESFNFFSSVKDITPIGVFSDNVERLKVSNYFSTKAFMKTIRKGLYYVTLGADDGTRLFVDNQPVYDNWRTSRSTGYKPVENQIIKLTGDNTLHYEYFNKSVPLKYLFEISDDHKIIENTIFGEQTLCEGDQASNITGDDFKQKNQQDYKIVFGFQWYYDTNPNGNERIAITGATQKDFTPDTQTTPFNQAGTYYLFREASVRFKNIGMSEKTESIFSNPIRIEILKVPKVSIKPNSNEICERGSAEIRVVVNDGIGGTPPFTLSYKVNGVTLQVKSNENTFNYSHQYQPSRNI
ncbi:hypothetical protein ACI76O_05625 [Capnocytophaga cynodegmi]|uniref:hypothetical protein n=1 Tax=Capnocytophaga cynodegmi TaxID=28189 RepID=UPI0038591B62